MWDGNQVPINIAIYASLTTFRYYEERTAIHFPGFNKLPNAPLMDGMWRAEANQETLEGLCELLTNCGMSVERN
jgi:hypothetical protein